jgi:hypothetical protein
MTAAAKPTTMTGRARHEVHPAALAFPEMPAAELEELADDIKQNGLAHPIVLSVMASFSTAATASAPAIGASIRTMTA